MSGRPERAVEPIEAVPYVNDAEARTRRRARQRRRLEHLIDRVTREAPLARTDAPVPDERRTG
jgi:hypothetical protein